MQSDECRVTSDESRPLRPTAIRKGRIGAVGKGGLCTLHSTLVTGFLLLFSFTCTRDWKNPYDDVNYNTPPTARVRLSHTAGTVDTLFIADASGSFDAEDSTADLKFRWDWESDGTWDNDWSASAIIDSYRFSDGGVKAVKLAVQDKGGMGDTVVVTLGINAAPVARFRVTPRLNNFAYSVTVDAGASTDQEDDSTAFEYRWNFGNGDGWTAWSPSGTLSYAYVIADKNALHVRAIALEVRDSGGAVGTADTSLIIDLHPGMRYVAGGQFVMGSGYENDTVNNPYAGRGFFVDELPERQVSVSPFWMDSVEVTQADYTALMGTNPSAFRGGDPELMPVERISWNMAVLYCNARSRRDGLDTVYSYVSSSTYSIDGIPVTYTELAGVAIHYDRCGYRLPTEAEWEYACLGGQNDAVFYGGAYLDGHAWYADNSGMYAHQVAGLAPNGFGLYDLLGNVMEWCNDWYEAYPVSSGIDADPHGPAMPVLPGSQLKVIRGDSYDSLEPSIRPARRFKLLLIDLDGSSSYIGFRAVLPAQ